MEHILSKQSHRFLTTLENLYQNEHTSYETLAFLSDVSVKTIQDDIKKINGFITPLYIDTHSSHSCHLVKQDNISRDFIYSCILSNSLEFSVLEIVFFEQEERLEDYADALFVSLSTLKRIIAKINKRIKKNGFQISTNPIQLVGDEEAICHTMTNFFKEKYLTEDFPFSDIQYKIFDQLMYYTHVNYKQFFNYPDINRFKLYSFVSIIRMQNGHFYNNATHEEAIKDTQYFSFLDNQLFTQAFKSVFHIELSKKNFVDMAYPFLNEEFAFSYEEMLLITNKNPYQKTEIDNLSLMIDDISQAVHLKIQEEKKQKLLLDIYNGQLLNFDKNYLLYNDKRYFFINLTNDYPVVYQLLNEKIIQNPRFRDYTDEKIEKLIYILLTHWKELLFAIQDTQPRFTAGLFMSSDVEHSELMADMLNRKFYKRFDFQSVVFTDLEDATRQFKNYDVIFTNVSNLVYEDTKIISIDLYPTMRDYAKIHQLYYELQP